MTSSIAIAMGRWLRRPAAALARVPSAAEPLIPVRAIRRDLRRTLRGTQRDGFGAQALPRRSELRRSLDFWPATSLAPLFPAVIALYEMVPGRHCGLDQLTSR